MIDKDWDWITQDDVRDILDRIDTDPKKEKPQKLKAGVDIPTEEELQYLSNAAINPRDKAIFEMARELGLRIGGIGSRQLKHVSFDELGAKVTIYDKTMRGEPVRFVSSSSYLRI
ncbi:MAG TPA: hypothetical protein VMW20_09720 [Candidatus Nanoarchaeia archaeon]|nr:hypothetical protein [Candidatus Nanoarchaeia archaeon]